MTGSLPNRPRPSQATSYQTTAKNPLKIAPRTSSCSDRSDRPAPSRKTDITSDLESDASEHDSTDVSDGGSEYATMESELDISGSEDPTANPPAHHLDRLRRLKEAVMQEQMKYTQERARKGVGMPRPRTPSSGMQTHRISPITEEGSGSGDTPKISPSLQAAFAVSPLTTGAQTASTESTDSVRTVRASVPPTPAGQVPLRTPSYPFPYVPGTPRVWSSSFHKPFTTLSPTVSSMNIYDHTPGDMTTSEVSTPAAPHVPFQPPGTSPLRTTGDEELYPLPNLYDLSIELSLEPGMHAWWSAVSRILSRDYRAVRASLAIPADAGDLENVPWGQIASYSAVGKPGTRNNLQGERDTGNNGKPDSRLQPSTPAPLRSVFQEEERPSMSRSTTAGVSRPGMISRHSYAGYERDQKDLPTMTTLDLPRADRPRGVLRTKSYAPHLATGTAGAETRSRLTFSLNTPGQNSTWSDLDFSSIATSDQTVPYMAVLSRLQGVSFEEHALINSTNVNRIIKAGKLVALTREYSAELPAPFGARTASPQVISASPPDISSTKGKQKETAESKLRLPKDYFSREAVRLPEFEEFEQFPCSPWAQSPAPSPAVQADPEENPFFTGREVDESSFVPREPTPDYANNKPVEAIGVDRASTVIHVPLIHPVLSQTLPTSRRGGHQRRGDKVSEEDSPAIKKAPIAILSMLSPVVPYPTHLLSSLKMLALHLATSLGMAQQYTNAQRQASSLAHRRMQSGSKVGFASLGEDKASLDFLLDADLDYWPTSVSDTLTSPSDYSGRSRASPGGSLLGTPGWESSSMMLGRHSGANTPAHGHEGSESYFEAYQRSPAARSGSNTALHRTTSDDQGRPMPRKGDELDPKKSGECRRRTFSQEEKSRSGQSSKRSSKSSASQQPQQQKSDRADRKHSYLHSYGADFAASFQMLPSTATHAARTSALPSEMPHSMPDMLPPSERLLRTIIDALPVQIFTAAPSTGALTWVNSKFVAYRGKEPQQIIENPWQSIHPNDLEQYMEQWQQSLSTGQHFSHKVRLQRFDDVYRWFFVRATPLKDKKQKIVHWTGTYMDIHEQHIAEQNMARQVETAASEAKYRALANSSPQIVFAATRSRGVTFCNSQWLVYSGQSESQARGLGFMELVHQDDIGKCRLPVFNEDGTVAEVPTSLPLESMRRQDSTISSSDDSSDYAKTVTSPGTTPLASVPQAELSKLASTGILKVSRDSDGRPSYSTEVRLRNKEGEYRWHLVRVLQAETVRQDDEDEEETWYGTCTDINDHKLLEQTLKDTMDAKSRFLSNMSHEIRTPLNGITGMVNFLIDSHLSQEQLEHVHIIRNSTEGLRDLINDILDLSKVEAGMITLQMEWFHVRSLIEEVNDLTSSMAIGKGLELNYLIGDDVPPNVKGDRFRIRQVLLNVVGNAIKFTQQGEVFVRLEKIQDPQAEVADNEVLIRFFVQDTGSGFTSAEAEFLFKRFSQIDSSSTKQHGGTGLGLAISKQLVQLHGGDMDAKSVPGEGATFYFHAKFAIPSDGDTPPPRVSTPGLLSAAVTPSVLPPKRPIVPGPQWSPQLARTDSDSSSSIASPSRHLDSSASGTSSGSSNPSIRTSRASILSARSSTSSLASVPILPITLEMPPRKGAAAAEDSNTPGSNTSVETVRPRSGSVIGPELKSPVPPAMFSILVICPLNYARQAIVKHIDTTIPNNTPHHITAPENLNECKQMLGLLPGLEPVIFTHVVLIQRQASEIASIAKQIFRSASYSSTALIIISDFSQRKEIEEMSDGIDFRKMTEQGRLRWLSKPLKPSKFAIIFDPQKLRELSTDRSQDSAQAVVMNQKQIFEEMKQRLGNQGFRVLLVEDNRTNQMVLQKFLKKVDLDVETVLDGVECTDAVFSHQHDYYSIILCDLHMPNKDGYQTCKEIRRWERKNKTSPMPIIALSANVLGDVYAKCADAGFNSYVTKPVDFKELSIVMLKYMESPDPTKPIEFMSKTRR